MPFLPTNPESGPGDTDIFSGTIKDRDITGMTDGKPSLLSLTKEGGGTQVLTGRSSYSGGTAIAGGTLELASPRAAGSGGITFTGAATLRIDDAAETVTGAASRDFVNVIGGTTTANQLIDLTSLAFKDGTTMATLLNGTLTVNNGSTAPGTDTVTLHVTNGNGKLFQTASDGHGGTLVYDPPVTAADTHWLGAMTADVGGAGGADGSHAATTYDLGTPATSALSLDHHAAAASVSYAGKTV